MKRLALVLVVALSAFAQKPAPIELGFKEGRVYDFNSIDSVNAFNGNTIITIPLGLQYPVTSSLNLIGLPPHLFGHSWVNREGRVTTDLTSPGNVETIEAEREAKQNYEASPFP